MKKKILIVLAVGLIKSLSYGAAVEEVEEGWEMVHPVTSLPESLKSSPEVDKEHAHSPEGKQTGASPPKAKKAANHKGSASECRYKARRTLQKENPWKEQKSS